MSGDGRPAPPARQRPWERIRRRYRGLDGHQREILKGTATAFVLKTGSVGLAFLVSVVLGRLLGPAGAGLYFLALTLVTVAFTLGRVGLDNAVVRFVAGHAAAGEWPAVMGVYRKSVAITLAAASVLAAALVIAAPWVATAWFGQRDLAGPLEVMGLATAPVALMLLHASALQGLKRVADSVLLTSTWLSLFTLPGLWFLVPRHGVDGAALAYLLAGLLAMSIGVWRWRAATPAVRGLRPAFAYSELLGSALPLLGVSSLNLVLTWSTTLILGQSGSAEEVGMFGAAQRTAQLIVFALWAVNSITVPKFAELWRMGDRDGLSRTARRSTALATLLALPVVLVFVLFPAGVMGLYGPGFERGATVLVILCAGQFFNAATGAVAYLLMMTGHERLVRNNLAFWALVNIGLGLFLIPKFGMAGAAAVTAFVVGGQNLTAVALVRRKLGILLLGARLTGR